MDQSGGWEDSNLADSPECATIRCTFGDCGSGVAPERAQPGRQSPPHALQTPLRRGLCMATCDALRGSSASSLWMTVSGGVCGWEILCSRSL